MTPEEFWRKVDKSGGPDACWPWIGARKRGSYGVTSVDRQQMTCHRLAWIYTNGVISDGLIVRHKVCDNPACCNPAHLATGTHQDNSNDCTEKRRQSFGEKHSQAVMPNRPRGENHYASKINEDQAREIYRLYADTKTPLKEICDRFGVKKAAIRRIVQGETWKHLGLPPIALDRRPPVIKHTPEKIVEILRLKKEGWTVKAIAAHFSMSINMLNDIIYRRPVKE